MRSRPPRTRRWVVGDSCPWLSLLFGGFRHGGGLAIDLSGRGADANGRMPPDMADGQPPAPFKNDRTADILLHWQRTGQVYRSGSVLRSIRTATSSGVPPPIAARLDATLGGVSLNATGTVALPELPVITIGVLVEPGDKTDEGQLIGS